VDENQEKVEALCKGHIPIYEPGLEAIVRKNLHNERLRFTSALAEGVEPSETVFICVGTPPGDDGKLDLSMLERAAGEIASCIDGYKLVVVKSTVPVGTCKKVQEIIRHNTTGEFDVVSNPEFLREGSAVTDTLNPDRIVLGVPGARAANLLIELYKPFGKPFIIIDVPSAEMVKYASNAFLALKISFINSIADLCETVGANVHHVADGMGMDRRIVRDFLNAGLGYGGSCFPKDLSDFITTFEEFGCDSDLLEAVRKVNDHRVPRLMDRVKKVVDLKGKTAAVLGLSFKPETDDIREAKSLEVIRSLLKMGARVQAYDPNPEAMEKVKELYPGVHYAADAYQAVEGAQAMLLITEWREFQHLDMRKIKEKMERPMIFDGRNLYHPESMRDMGYEYFSIGRPD
jgi:UDPglucose 6-dehydrogenase